MSGWLELGNKQKAAETYLSTGNIYFDRSEFDEALKNYQISLDLCKEVSNFYTLGFVYSALGITYHQQKKYQLAVQYLDSARLTGEKISDKYTVLDAYDVLSQIYAEQNKYEQALLYFKKYSMLKDSLNEAGTKSDIAELEIKYQNEKKNAEILGLKTDQALKEAALSRQRAIQIGTTITLLLVIAISLLFINRYRVMNRTNRLLEVERMRNGIARDLHDDIGSALSSINILSKIARIEKNNTESYFEKVGVQSSRIMENMSDMVWSLSPANDTISQLTPRMREFASEILEPKNIKYLFYKV